MKLDYNPAAPLNLDWMNYVLFRYPHQFPRLQPMMAEFKREWQMGLDLNQQPEIRLAHRNECERIGRKLFDNFLGRDTIPV